MKLRYAFAMLAAAGALTGSAAAEEPPPETDLQRLQSMVKPGDVDLVFQYLREAAKASGEGRALPLPPAQLVQRAQEVEQSLKQHGGMTMDQLLQQIQRQARKSLPPAASPDVPLGHSTYPPGPHP
ncbi:MAG: hypothetical protein ACLPXB_06550 [Thiobacillaceae bacterium]